MNKRKFKLLSLFSLLTLAFSASAIFAFASWQYNSNDTSSNNTSAVISNWSFDAPLPIEPGQTITVDNNGNVYINGEKRDDAEVTYPKGEEPDTGGGSITYKIGVVDGELAVTEYTASDLGKSWFSFSATATLPSSISVNGETFPIMGLSQPLELNVGSVLVGRTVDLNVPEGYRYLCNNAFQNVSADGNATINFSLPKSLESLGNHAFKLNASGVRVNITYAGTKAEFNALVEASKAEFGSDYVFFTGASGNVSVTCSDGYAVYDRNGVYQG